jgi:hypothetical protein
MSKNESVGSPRSLTQHFEAPADFTGVFGWVCGYSADAAFMNEAVERFTRQSEAQRAYQGKAALALVLDPGNAYLAFSAVPGVVHLGRLNDAKTPFLLMHAKLAILAFQNPVDTSQWLLRLVVSTGNWTRQTLEDSLDLAWCVEVSSDDLVNKDDQARQACADIEAAAEFFAWLKPYFELRILNVSGDRANSPSDSDRFDSLLSEVTRKTGRMKPRFFSSIKGSLLNQLPGMVNNLDSHASTQVAKRNYLAMGSGFYEAPTAEMPVPTVLLDIVEKLQKAELLKTKPAYGVDIFVNPKVCQAVADCMIGLKNDGFTVRAAQAPERLFGKESNRSLHAKFIFSYSERAGSNKCNNAWLYLGSGNLTKAGFSSEAPQSGRNLEAGVVFSPEGLRWAFEKGMDPDKLVTNLLPIHWDSTLSAQQPPTAGKGMDEHGDQYIAAPVAWLCWREDKADRYLQSPVGGTVEFAVMDDTGAAQSADNQGRVLWSRERPREVTLAWKDGGVEHTALVPVIDEFGRIAGATLPKLQLDQAWWQLENFPLPPDEDDLVDESIDSDSGTPATGSANAAATTAASYPIRQVMELVENIADKQTQLAQSDWSAWCTRLEQCLLQASESPALEEFVNLEINPLSPLWSAPFRPDFAENDQTPEGRRYEAVLQRVEKAWAVTSLNKLEASHA